MPFSTYSPSLASKWFSVKGSTALGGRGKHCWEMCDGIFGHHNNLGNGGGRKEANILRNKELFPQIPVMPQMRSRNSGGELEIL